MKPPFAYFGGKTRIAERIAALLPTHGHYVEPFAGSLAVLLAKKPAALETVNDLDRELVRFWRVLRDRPTDLLRACALTPHSRAEHTDAATPADGEIEQARRTWVRLSQGRSGTLRRAGWRYHINPVGQLPVPGYLGAYLDRMAAIAERLGHVSLECRPALEVIAAYGTHPEVLLYVDPPYLGATRPNSPHAYRHEMTDEDQHRELAAALRACRAAVVLSGYPSSLYERLFANWHTTRITATTQRGGTGRTRVEVLWSNRPLNPYPDPRDQPTTPSTGKAA